MLGKLTIISLLQASAFAAPRGSQLRNRATRAVTASTGQTVFKFPLDNGFPNITVPSDALWEIEQSAYGRLPNTGLPTKMANGSATVWSLIAFNELFEVAFFTSLINNITENVDGYELHGQERLAMLDALYVIQAQEELHALGANAFLTSAGFDAVQPCEYIFPVADLDSAITFAFTFTDIVLGVLQEALTAFGLDGDTEFLGLVGSVIGQEGEQNGFFRSYEGRVPSALPFLTATTGVFAASALNQLVISPGSCPQNLSAIPVLKPLTLDTSYVGTSTTTVKFSFTGNYSSSELTGLSLVYVNQLNAPIVENLQNITASDGTITFSAVFPYVANELNGLTLAAVTNSAGPFANVSAVAAAAEFGPAIIEVN